MEYEIVLVKEVSVQQFTDRIAQAVWNNLVIHYRVQDAPAVEERIRSAVSWYFERCLEDETVSGIRRVLRFAPPGAAREDDLDRSLTAEIMNALARELPSSPAVDTMTPAVVGALREILDPLVRPLPAPDRRMATPLGPLRARIAAGFGGTAPPGR